MKKQIIFFVLAGFFVTFLAHPRPSYAQLNMLIYGDTDPGISDTAPGFNVTVWNDATWTAASTADFAAFNVIVFADAPAPFCLTSSSVWNTAIATQATWGPAITGNVLIIGSDPDYHITNSGVSPNVEYNFLNFAASGKGTGLYVALSCVFNGVSPSTAVPLLSPLGTFTVEGAASGGYDAAHIVADSPALTGVTDTMLSNWDFSVHEGFDVWPSTFIPLAIATDATDPNYTASDGTSGLVYILASGQIVNLGTNTPTPYPSNTPTPTPNFTLTLTPVNTSTPTPTPNLTLTLTPPNTPTPTSTLTLTPTPTISSTPTVTTTSTLTFTVTLTATKTESFTPTNSPTLTDTFTITNTPTMTYSPTITPTPTATVPTFDVFYVSANEFNPSTDNPVSIYVGYSAYPGEYDLWIYNSAGEHIKTLDHQEMSGPLTQSYHWDGTNKYGDKCASGVYIFYLVEPFSQKMKRIALIR